MGIDILVVEDNEYKRKRIVEVIKSDFNDCIVTESYSFTSAWKFISEHVFDVIFRIFGGKELARKMGKRNVKSKFIFITQYKSFSDNINSYSYDDLKSELLCKYSSNCLGFILYSNTKSEWRDELVKSIKELEK